MLARAPAVICDLGTDEVVFHALFWVARCSVLRKMQGSELIMNHRCTTSSTPRVSWAKRIVLIFGLLGLVLAYSILSNDLTSLGGEEVGRLNQGGSSLPSTVEADNYDAALVGGTGIDSGSREPLGTGVVLQVLVLTPEGSPVVGAHVQVGEAATTTTEDGRAWFDKEVLLKMGVASYLVVEASKGTSNGRTLAPLGAENLIVRLSAAPHQPIGGVVVEQGSGTPLQNATVRSGSLQVTTDDDGRFEFPATRFRLFELSVLRNSRLIHRQGIPFGKEHRIVVPQTQAVTLNFIPSVPHMGTVMLYAVFGDKSMPLGGPLSIESRSSIELTDLPAHAAGLLALIQCQGYAKLEHQVVLGDANFVRLEPVEPLSIITSPPPPGHRITVTVELRYSGSERYQKMEQTELKPSGEAIFYSLPSDGVASVYLDATPLTGHGSIRILSQVLDLSERTIDLTQIALFAVRFECEPSNSSQPFQLTLEFSDSYGPDVPNRWMSWGSETVYGHAKKARLRSDSLGVLELTLPRSEMTATAFSGSRILGKSNHRIDGMETVIVRVEKRVSVEFSLIANGEPASGRRLMLTPPRGGRFPASLIPETLTFVADANGRVRTELYSQKYSYKVEGMHGIVEGLMGDIEACDDLRVECHLPALSRLHVTNSA